MPYFGNKPADQAIQIGSDTILSSHIDDGVIVDADINASASIAVSKTQLTGGTGLTLSSNTLSVDASQSQITSVGTLSSLTTSGSTGSNYIGSFTNTSATGWGLFVKGGADNADYSLRVQDKDADDLLAVKSGGRIGINTNDPASQLHIFSDAGGVDTILEIECNATNASAMLVLDSHTDRDSGVYFQENGTYKGGMFNDSSEDATVIMDGSNANVMYLKGNNVGIGHTSPQFGLTLTEGDLDANSIGWESSGNTKRGSIRMNPADYMKFNIGGGDRLWIGNATDNWAMNLTGNSPYGMQITTTSDGSSSHDAFVIKKQPSGGSLTKVFEIFNDGTLKTYGGSLSAVSSGTGSRFLGFYSNTTTLSAFLEKSGNNFTLYNADAGELRLNTNDSNQLVITGGASATATFTGKIDFTGSPNMGNRPHSVNVASGATSTYNMNGAGGNCSGGFIVGSCKRDGSITADNSVIIMAHLHTQGANVYSTILERNDDSDVTITRSGGNLTCTNNGNSTVNFVVKYILLTGLDGSNNLV